MSKISASMMCSNLEHLSDTIKVFEEEKIDYLHIDVMDGEFVPNFGLGVDYIRELRTEYVIFRISVSKSLQ